MISQYDALKLRHELNKLQQSVTDLSKLINELEDRCQHSDYPYGEPSLIRCHLPRDHEGKHEYLDSEGEVIKRHEIWKGI
jgi:hypothetical protein